VLLPEGGNGQHHRCAQQYQGDHGRRD
jgi:hypothetical protein